jgi:hypothetical protein
MTIAFASRLSFSMRRRAVSAAPYFSNGEGSANVRIQCQLPEFSVVFARAALFKKSPLSRLHFFASSRLRVNPLHPHGVRRGRMYLTRRRKGAKLLRA